MWSRLTRILRVMLVNQLKVWRVTYWVPNLSHSWVLISANSPPKGSSVT